MNDSRGLSVDERLERLLTQRYPGAPLDALGGGFFKKIGKALKKIAPVALGAAALYFGGPVAGKLVAGAAGKLKKGGKAGKAGKAGSGVKLSKAAKKAARVASQAVATGAIPLQPGALRSNEELVATAVQIARNELTQQGVNMRSPDAQDIVRQAVQEAGQVPPAEGFDWKKALPWVAGGGLLLAVAMMGARRPR